MEKPLKGDIVVIPFPFSDLSFSNKRPALVLADIKGNDLILCQITSKDIKDEYSIPLDDKEMASGKLNQISNIRPNRIFTADKSIILYKVGSITKTKLSQVIEKLFAILKQ
jgi:mRNA interferase MazF